jgi:hypothetical protein
MTVRVLLGALAALLSCSSVAFACFCVPSFRCPVLGSSGGPVFLGTVLEVTDTGTAAFLGGRKARIRVNESFGGLSPDATEINVLTGLGGGDCGVPFRPGETYLVSAFTSKEGLVHASICSSTRRIDVVGAALRILRQLRDGQSLPSLAGRIVQLDRNFDGLLGTYPPRPLANTLVRVTSNGKSYDTQADTEGLYAFYGLPTGRYEFAPDLPQGTTLAWYIGSERPQVPFDLRGTECKERDIEVFRRRVNSGPSPR